MTRSLVIIIILILIVFNFQISKVDSFFCKPIAGIVNSLYFVNKQIDFYVYKNGNDEPQKASCLDKCDLNNLQFNPSVRTTVIIHGFLSDHKTYWIKWLIKELLIWQNMNIVVVDWSEFFNVNYYQSAIKVTNVAIQVNRFLEEVAAVSNKDIKDWPYLHFIGHSLGAHVAGLTASILKEKILVHRITALDPAKPYFVDKGSYLKLDKTFARFVDVIHTNGSPNEQTFGLFEPLEKISNNVFQGHIDFYPNGGDKQPNCSGGKIRKRLINPLECLSELIFGVDLIPLKMNYLWRILSGNNMICDHGVSQKYFVESINDQKRFIAEKLDNIFGNASTDCTFENGTGRDCVTMGMHSYLYNDTQYHGIYYVNTEYDSFIHKHLSFGDTLFKV